MEIKIPEGSAWAKAAGFGLAGAIVSFSLIFKLWGDERMDIASGMGVLVALVAWAILALSPAKKSADKSGPET